MLNFFSFVFFFQAEDGIRDLVRSRGLGDVYKRQGIHVLQRLLVSKMRCGLCQRWILGYDEIVKNTTT